MARDLHKRDSLRLLLLGRGACAKVGCKASDMLLRLHQTQTVKMRLCQSRAKYGKGWMGNIV